MIKVMYIRSKDKYYFISFIGEIGGEIHYFKDLNKLLKRAFKDDNLIIYLDGEKIKEV